MACTPVPSSSPTSAWVKASKKALAPAYVALPAMPILSGPELARRIRDLRPGIKTLFLSGYTEQLVNADGRLAGMDGFLIKPLDRDKLAEALASLAASRQLAA